MVRWKGVTATVPALELEAERHFREGDCLASESSASDHARGSRREKSDERPAMTETWPPGGHRLLAPGRRMEQAERNSAEVIRTY